MGGPARACALAVAIATALFACAAAAEPAPQDAVAPERPKVALVLSGGGALGVAHVGVIQELDRLGIRPDMVVGTSMGAVVGGLYAAGYSGEELERVVSELDWSGMFDFTPPTEGLSFRQKKDQANFPMKARFRFKDGQFSMPSGLVPDQNMLIALRDLVRQKGVIADFARLPTPFQAVAADIETGKHVVLKSGDLASAMRASFSVPGVLAPMKYDGQLLVDGGIAMNLPIEIAQDMGADIVIAVRLVNTLKTKDELKTAVDVVSQTVSLLLIKNEDEQLRRLGPKDIRIDIELGGFASTSFAEVAKLVDPGRKAVAPVEGRLRALANGTYAPKAPVPIVVEFIDVETDARLDKAVIEARIDVEPGKPLDAEQLNRDLTEIYALGAFERVDYTIAEKGGKTGLVVRATKAQGGYDYVRAGVSLETNFDGEAGYAISFDYTASALDAYGAEWRVEGVIGDRLRLYTEYFQPLDPMQSWFVMPRLGLQAFDVPVFDAGGFKLAEFRTLFGAATVEAGRQFGDWGELRVGVERGIGTAELNEGTAPVSEVDVEIGRVFVQGGIDTLDQPYFATRGSRAAARWTQALKALGSDFEYQTLSLDFSHALSWNNNRLVLSAAAGTTLDGNLPVEALYRLGGPFSLSGLQRDELTGEAFGRAGLLYALKLNEADPRFFGVPIYLGGSLEAGNAWADRGDAALDDVIASGSLFVGADTFLGPAFVGYGRAEGDRQSLYLFFGRPF